MALAHPLHPIRSRWSNKRRNLWIEWCVLFWWPCFWPVHWTYYTHTIYHSCILSNWDKPFLRDMRTKCWVWPWWCVGWHDTVILSCLLSNLHLSCSGFSESWYGYRYHLPLCIGQLHPITVYRTVFWVRVVLVLCHYVLLLLIPQ